MNIIVIVERYVSQQPYLKPVGSMHVFVAFAGGERNRVAAVFVAFDGM